MLLFALGIKHIICNFILRPFIIAFENKLLRSGSPATGVVYVFCHILATLLVLTSFTSFTPTLLLISVVAALIHYLIDQHNNITDPELDSIVKTNTKWLNGFDQWIHGFVYLVMSALLLSFGLMR
ncbi:MAG: hypothetical protein CTY12_08655 [Methylotenera sp.]|nr:MAG: hypothetical protein CTY12_08655 [Methylotenera sp.]